MKTFIFTAILLLTNLISYSQSNLSLSMHQVKNVYLRGANSMDEVLSNPNSVSDVFTSDCNYEFDFDKNEYVVYNSNGKNERNKILKMEKNKNKISIQALSGTDDERFDDVCPVNFIIDTKTRTVILHYKDVTTNIYEVFEPPNVLIASK